MTDDPNPVRTMLEQMTSQLAGKRIHGGCESCNAYQEFWSEPKHPGIFHVTIFHDDWCPEHPADDLPS